jgi:hypothetical protein
LKNLVGYGISNNRKKRSKVHSVFKMHLFLITETISLKKPVTSFESRLNINDSNWFGIFLNIIPTKR